MKKVLQIVSLVIIAGLLLSACSMTIPVASTGKPVGPKVGEASGNGYFYMFRFGVDTSIRTAAMNGGITEISTVDYQMKDILGIVQTYTCIVTGK